MVFAPSRLAAIDRLTTPEYLGYDILMRYRHRISNRAISLKVSEDLLSAADRLAAELDMTRAEYMRAAIEEANRRTEAHLRARRLTEASRRVRAESMRVNRDLEAIADDPDV